MKTLSFINKVLEFNYECEYQFNPLNRSKCFMIKTFNEDLELLIRRIVKPGTYFEIENVLQKIFENADLLF